MAWHRTIGALGAAIVPLAVGIALGLAAGGAEAVGEMATGRGVHTDQRIDLPLDPATVDAPKPMHAVAPVRLAAGDNNADVLKSLAPRLAPLEVVARSDRPDLVWDVAARTLIDRDQIVAYDIDAGDVARAADRVALVRLLRDLSQKAGQPVKLQPDDRTYKAGQRFDIQLADTRARFVLVFAVSGDGTVGLLYPRPSDPAQVADAALTLSVMAGAPFGLDQVVAITSGEAHQTFLQALRRLDRRKAAGEVLGLIDGLPEGSCRFGLLAVATQP